MIFGMLHHLVDLYQVVSNCTPGAKIGPALGSHDLFRLLKGKHENIFLSATRGPRALIFGTKHHLVDLCQVCLYYTPEAKNGSAPGVTYFT